MKFVCRALAKLCVVFLISDLSAQWQLVQNFCDGDLSDWEVTYWGEEEASVMPSIEIVDWMGNSGVLKIDPGVPGNVNLGMIAEFQLPASQQIVADFPNQSKSTFYYRIARPLVSGRPGEADIVLGFGKSLEADESGGYGSLSVLTRYESDGIMDVRNGGSYENLSDRALSIDVFYEVWQVIDHDANTFSVYIRGGNDYQTQTLVAKDKAYRLETHDPLTRFVLITAAGNLIDGIKGKDPIYIDDIYVDVGGENLSYSDSFSLPVPVSSRLTNLSTRGVVGEGNDVLIGGFVISGTDPIKVLIQGVGKELVGFGGLTTDDVLEDGILTVSSGDQVFSDDDWDTSLSADMEEDMALSGLFPLVEGSKSSALVLELEPGAYTAVLSGVDGASGVALIEMMELVEDEVNEVDPGSLCY